VFNFISCMRMSEYEIMWMTFIIGCVYLSYVSTMRVNVYLTCGFSYYVCGDEFTICGNYMFFVLSQVEGNKIGSTFVCC
jgi:hypothetical protein